MTYDAAGNPLSIRDRRGILTEMSYDAENRRVSTTRAGVVIERLGYDANGNVILQTDANGNVTSFEYDERDLAVSENRPLAAITRRTYDDMGDVTQVRDPEGRIAIRSYDVRRRLVTETLAAHSDRPETTTFECDLNGNRTLMRRPEGGEWIYDYDGADRLVTVTDPEQGVTTYTWDKNSNPETQTDANHNTTTFTYDELDRVTRQDYADGAFETSAYDGNGNLVERRDAKGQVTTFSYDVLNRQTLAVFTEDPSTDDDLLSIAQIYDANNNVIEVRESFAQSGDQVTARTYDSFDRLETETDRWNNVLRYAYDANGNRTQLTDPSRQVTTYAYDALNRLAAVTTTGGVTEFTYFRDSRIRQVRYPNGTTASYVYDEAGRARSIDNRQYDALVSSFSYRYDLNGNRVEQLEERSGEGVETTTYAYDLADRLSEVMYPDKTTTYTYDDAGNRLTEQEENLAGNVIADKVFTYNVRNQLEQLDNVVDPSRSVTYGYDANGNQVSRATAAGETTAFAFDVLDRLTQVEKDGSSLGTYRYDAQGLRVEKVTAEGATRYVYDESSVLTRTDAGGTTKYEYGPDRLLSVNHPTEGRAYYLFDALGSVVNLTTPQGTLLGRYKYDAWGNYREVSGTVANPFGFTGHEHDSETGLIYAKARFYDPEIGLFLSEDPAAGDPMNPPSLHRYLYAYQNPTVYVDPDGSTALGKDAQKWFERGGTENAAELAALIQDEYGWFAGRSAAQILGVLGFAADATAGTIGLVDTALNVVVASVLPETSFGQASAAELNETYDSVTETAKFVWENRAAVGASIVDGVVETSIGVLKGDAAATTRATSFLAGFITPTSKVSTAGNTVRRLARTARVLEEAASDTAKTVNRGSRLSRLRQLLTRKKPETPRLAEVGRAARPRRCFVAGTLVATSTGLRPIEEMAVGDLVWSRNEETGETRLQEVVELFQTPDQVVYDVELEAGNGTVETLGVTAEHPFRVAGVGWVGAADLEPGDEIVSNRDGWLKVRQVRGSPDRAPVYNFEVAADHTYFVGASEAWVHNLCETGKARLAELRERLAARLSGEELPSGNPGFGRYEAQHRQIQKALAEAESRPPDLPLFGDVRLSPS